MLQKPNNLTCRFIVLISLGAPPLLLELSIQP